MLGLYDLHHPGAGPGLGLRAAGGRQDHDAADAPEAVHLSKQPVQGPLLPAVSAHGAAGCA